jgi:hypothetical protein
MADMDTAELIESLVTDGIHWMQVASPGPDANVYEHRANEVLARIRGELGYLDRNFIDGLLRHLAKQGEAVQELRDRIGGDPDLVDLVESPELRKVFRGKVTATALKHGATSGTVSITSVATVANSQWASLLMNLPPADLEDWACGQEYEIAVVER